MTQGTKIRVALSRLLNTLVGGQPDEMLSTRAYREDIKWLERTIDTIFFWESGHCEKSYLWESAVLWRKIQNLNRQTLRDVEGTNKLVTKQYDYIMQCYSRKHRLAKNESKASRR